MDRKNKTVSLARTALRYALRKQLCYSRPLALITALCSFFMHQGFCGQTLEVCAQCTYKTIQSALDAAHDGAHIEVAAGIYKESDLHINKNIQITGAPHHQTLIDANNHLGIFVVHAPSVVIRGFKLINTGHASIQDIAAIRVENTSDCIIDDNEIENTTYGIYLAKIQNCTILHNHLRTNRIDSDESGSGIHVWSGSDINIIGNDISGHRDGIYFEFVKNSKIIENNSHHNLRYGLHFMFSNTDDYERNDFIDNESGVAVMYSKFITMVANRFEKSLGAASYGLLLKDISDSQIRGNLFFKNTTGLYTEGCTRTRIFENDFTDNGWAIRLVSSSDQNRFEDNNFSLNTFEVGALAGSTSNIFDHNYWSQYEGLDLNKGGIGDLPYRPVKLSAVWMQTIDGASLLLKSLFMTLADRAEDLMPSITPENITDLHPLIRKRP